jgi:hypothetical protein
MNEFNLYQFDIKNNQQCIKSCFKFNFIFQLFLKHSRADFIPLYAEKRNTAKHKTKNTCNHNEHSKKKRLKLTKIFTNKNDFFSVPSQCSYPVSARERSGTKMFIKKIVKHFFFGYISSTFWLDLICLM